MLYTRIAVLILAAAALTAAGCKSMSSPDGTDLPWTQRQDWELTPNIPSSMLQQ